MLGKFSIILNVRTLIVGEDIMLYVLILGFYFSSVTIINNFERLIEDLEFLEK